MKSTLVRCLVLVLAVAGFTASTVSKAAAAQHTTINRSLSIVNTPTPMCPLNVPDGCGIDPDPPKKGR